MQPTRIAIRPNGTIGGKTMYMYIRSSRTGHVLLVEAAERFVATIGLVVAESHLDTDRDGLDFVRFTIGTGKDFVAFLAHDEMNE